MAQFTNQAQLRYGNTIANSNIAVGEILEVLSATKTAVRSSYSQNDTITYIVSVINSGSTAFSSLTLTDDLGGYTYNSSTLRPLTYVEGTVRYYVNGVLSTTPTVSATSPLTITGLGIPAGGNITVIYEAEINQYAPLAADSSITNTVTVSGTNVTAITATETVTAASEPILNITKSVSPVPVAENGTLTYTFLIQNFGNTAATATTGVVVTDTFNPVLSNLSVTYNGTAWTSPTNYTYDSSTGTFTTVSGAITVSEATFAQDTSTGSWAVSPSVGELVITGTI